MGASATSNPTLVTAAPTPAGTTSGSTNANTPTNTGSTPSNSSTGTTTGTTNNTTATPGIVPGNSGFAPVIPTDANGNPINPMPNANGTANGQTQANSGANVTSTTIISTPLLDEATKNAIAREQRRRAQGKQPTIIGIAPRTNADKTDQMPDDKVIRY